MKKRTIFLHIWIVCQLVCLQFTYAQPTPKQGKGDKYGFVNDKGEFVIEATYDEVDSFSNGIALVKKGGKYGFINESGKYVIQPKYTSIGMYDSLNLCKVRIGGTYDKNGVLKGAKFGFIDKNAHEIVKPKYDVTGEFDKNGICWIGIGGKFGYVSSSGKELTKIEYSDIGKSFHDGYSWVAKGGKGKEKYGFIDIKGHSVIPVKYDAVQDAFHNGMVGVKLGKLYGYVSSSGKETPIKYIYVGKFENDLGLVVTNPSKDLPKYGYISADGKEIIPPSFDDALVTFNEERSAVKKDGKWAIVNSEGKLLTGFDFGTVKEFQNGLAPVSEVIANESIGFWGLINKDGNFVVPYKYVYLGDVDENGMRMVGTKSPLKPLIEDVTSEEVTFDLETTKYILTAPELIEEYTNREIEKYEKANQEYSKTKEEIAKKIIESDTKASVIPKVNTTSTWVGKTSDFHGLSKDEKTVKIHEAIGTKKVNQIESRLEQEIKKSNQELTEKAKIRPMVDQTGLGWIDSEGKEIIPCVYENALPFSEGFAAVLKAKAGKHVYIFINLQNEVVLQTNYEYVTSFKDGLACVFDTFNRKWGAIDKSGKIIVPLILPTEYETRKVIKACYEVEIGKAISTRLIKFYWLNKHRPQDQYTTKDLIPDYMWNY